MSKEIAKNLMAIKMRSGVILWVEAERADRLQKILQGKLAGQHGFIDFDGETLNTADMEGVYKASTMADHQRRQNGEWQCKAGEWHDKFEKCTCAAGPEREKMMKRKACEFCKGKGVVPTGTGAVRMCQCVSG